MVTKVKGHGSGDPMKEGDTVISFLRPDERLVVIDTAKGNMIRCRSLDGREFWTARSGLKRVEAASATE